jgi:predicted acetyltransferase
MELEIIPAGDREYEIVRNLARFYLYDMAEHAQFPFEADGNMDAGEMFNPYWGRLRTNDTRPWPPEWKGHPFLARLDGHPAGFALVNDQATLIDMGEFFVARQYRRHRIGQRFATAMFDRFPGSWEVREMMTNVAAQKFWNRIIGEYTNGAFTETTEHFPRYGNNEFVVQRFVSGRR